MLVPSFFTTTKSGSSDNRYGVYYITWARLLANVKIVAFAKLESASYTMLNLHKTATTKAYLTQKTMINSCNLQTYHYFRYRLARSPCCAQSLKALLGQAKLSNLEFVLTICQGNIVLISQIGRKRQ